MKTQRTPLFRIWEGVQYAVLGASALSVISGSNVTRTDLATERPQLVISR